MERIYTQAPEVKQLVQSAFPDYRGRITVEVFTGPKQLTSCWSGGSRDYHVLINMATMQSVTIQENGTPWSNGGQIMQLSELPMNCALVTKSLTGRYESCSVYVTADNMNRLALPAPVNLTLAEEIVLVCTCERKSNYNGRNRQMMAQEDTGLPKQEWDNAKAVLISRGMLKSNGAVTDEGRNAVSSRKQLWNYKWKAQEAQAA